ncbi:MAG: hypothetical protein ACD_2C00061G0004 [uncultured bacterium (gcode 4)]|uniref:Uncharacterized protein n=1 Tax=uncultured bacterium (gcode 4) TaxID=1234023 RepID=K2GHS8_9BACT|nr:MAG: hypothetical protein ACD_2C00061G0004 [uncultured bacterium (gcode 4)]
MFAVAFWIYILIMLAIWSFFLVAKVHFFKFREYSQMMVPITKLIMLALFVLTFLWAYFVYNITGGIKAPTKTVEETWTNEVY